MSMPAVGQFFLAPEIALHFETHINGMAKFVREKPDMEGVAVSIEDKNILVLHPNTSRSLPQIMALTDLYNKTRIPEGMPLLRIHSTENPNKTIINFVTGPINTIEDAVTELFEKMSKDST